MPESVNASATKNVLEVMNSQVINASASVLRVAPPITGLTARDVSAFATKNVHATMSLILASVNAFATGDVHVTTPLIKANVNASVTEDVVQDMF